ncbi:hypothetical protein BCON_0111g00280 [Botryotinia convoluta]|uniref:Uncharacterized protein n=1 Tax=Botryotinia convoluta TaxID=54673 RepID=A0A4Z1HYP7_9HELO|nr:hypothetical protein BCON_0111g00280 [Botryotinia convoluta]
MIGDAASVVIRLLEILSAVPNSALKFVFPVLTTGLNGLGNLSNPDTSVNVSGVPVPGTIVSSLEKGVSPQLSAW